jgi:hypothetical protein
METTRWGKISVFLTSESAKPLHEEKLMPNRQGKNFMSGFIIVRLLQEISSFPGNGRMSGQLDVLAQAADGTICNRYFI